MITKSISYLFRKLNKIDFDLLNHQNLTFKTQKWRFRNFTLFHLWHLGEPWIVVISRKNLMKMKNSFSSTRTWPIAYLRKKYFWNEKNELKALFLYYIFENGYILLTWEIHSKMRKNKKRPRAGPWSVLSRPEGQHYGILSKTVYLFNYFGSISTQFRPGYKPTEITLRSLCLFKIQSTKNISRNFGLNFRNLEVDY